MKLLHCSRILVLALFSTASAEAALSVISIHYEGGGTNEVVLSWDTVPGKFYNLVGTPQLSSPSWAVLNAEPMLATRNVQVYRNSNVLSSRFYRVVELNPTVQP